MNKLLRNRQAHKLFFGIMMVAMSFLSLVESSYAQFNKPSMPWLSLTGEFDTYNRDWYPEGRIWIPPSTNSPREFLLPVFIDNRWATYPQTADRYPADPIKSFEFTVLYDKTTVRAIGIETSHPVTMEDGTNPNRTDRRFNPFYEPLAKGFVFSTSDYEDNYYRRYLNPNLKPTDIDPMKGRAFKIVATSTKPLPNTSLDRREFKVLLYIKFRIMPKEGVPNPSQSAKNSPIIIDHHVIKYNDLNIRTDAPFKLRRKIDPLTAGDYPDPSSWSKPGDAVTGIAGVRNDDISTLYAVEPHLPGTAYLRVMDNLPQFSFECARAIGTIPAVVETQPGSWELTDPITVDSTDQITPVFGIRTIQVKNPVTTTRLQDITVESDAPWLLFRTVKKGTNSKTPLPIPQLTTKGFINYIDNGIIGDPALSTPRGEENIAADGETHLEIRCDPSRLNITNPQDPMDGEKAGVHVAYITFWSTSAQYNPVKLKVTFIYFRSPMEYYRPGVAPGIHLKVSNTDAAAPGGKGFNKLMIFGTGHRATAGADLLFGERHYEYPAEANKFAARWYPWPVTEDPAIVAAYPNGFQDYAANDEEPRSDSRDIKDFNNNARSLYYYCKFDAGGVDKYPIVLEWDILDFFNDANLGNAQVYLRTILNGQLQQAVNMREATQTGPTTRSYTILDARITEFVIEYTLPTVIDYVNNSGEPIIKSGWNFLSLPVRPINSKYDVVYPNRMNIPVFWSQNQWQQPDQGFLIPGIGYFMKYHNQVDRKFAGTYIYDIDRPTDNIRLYPGNIGQKDKGGWNTIGSPSVPVNISVIEFTDFNGEIPDIAYTRKFGVWSYITNRGYEEVSELNPGLGYWIKVNKSGYLKISVPDALRRRKLDETFDKNDVLNSFAKINLADNAQNTKTLYLAANDVDASDFQVPPVPPAGVFDVRFDGDLYVSNSNESIVKLQGVTYPVSINIENADADYTIYDAVTGVELGTIKAGSINNVEINGTAYNAIKVVKTEVANVVAGLVNYPNPVTSVSTIKFNVPETGLVTVELFDALGNKVASLANEVMIAGEYTRNIDAANLANGAYVVKMSVGNVTKTTKVNVVK